jgi:hypothetical protein
MTINGQRRFDDNRAYDHIRAHISKEETLEMSTKIFIVQGLDPVQEV